MTGIIRRLVCVLLLYALLFSAAAGEEGLSFEEAYERTGQGVKLEPAEISLLPEDYSGFTVQADSDFCYVLTDMTGMIMGFKEDGSCSCTLPEDSARALLENAKLLSRGPDGAMLYFVSLNGGGVLFIRRDRTLTPLMQAVSRGAEDEYGRLKKCLDYKLNIDPSVVSGEVRWSPDGRFLFLNETEKWFGVRMDLDDPYLADTVTGEIFLLETHPAVSLSSGDPYRYIVGGRFSEDGIFYYLLRVRETDSDIRGVLMRCDPTAGTLETVWQTAGAPRDFCPLGEDGWLLLENDALVRLSKTDTGFEETREPLPASNGTLCPVSADLAILAVDLSPGIATALLPVRRDSTGPWLAVRNLGSGELAAMTEEEIAAERGNIRQTMSGNGTVTVPVIYGSWPDFGYILKLHVIHGTPLVLLPVNISLSVTSNWPGRLTVATALILLDTETMQCRTLWQEPWSYRDICNYRDPVLYHDSFSIGSCTLVLKPAEEKSEYPPSGDAEPVTSAGGITDYMSSDGMYEYRISSGTPALIPYRNQYGYLSLNYTDLDCTVTRSDRGWQIRAVFTRIPEPDTVLYMVPEALTAERYELITERLGKRDKKKFSPYYMLVKPDQLDNLENKEELLAAYPSLAAEPLYILRNDTTSSQQRNHLRDLEELLRKHDYSPEEFELDSSIVAVSRKTNAVAVQDRDAPKPRDYVAYAFPDAASGDSLTVSEMLQLAGLCDRICSAVFLQYVRPEGDPAPVETLIAGTYDPDGVAWNVAPDSAEDTGEQVIVTLTAVPED